MVHDPAGSRQSFDSDQKNTLARLLLLLYCTKFFFHFN